MNKYSINLTSQFNEELKNIYEYIYYTLSSPQTANKLYFKIKNSILSLESFPDSYPKIIFNNSKEHNFRKLIINKYVIIFKVQNVSNEVFILHIFHGSQNYIDKL